jgi:hypothetical protein
MRGLQLCKVYTGKRNQEVGVVSSQPSLVVMQAWFVYSLTT